MHFSIHVWWCHHCYYFWTNSLLWKSSQIANFKGQVKINLNPEESFFSFAARILVSVQQQSSSTPVPLAPLSVSYSPCVGLQTWPHVFVHLCCCSGWRWSKGAAAAELSARKRPWFSCRQAPVRLKRHPFSDPIRHLSYNLNILFSSPCFCLSLCVCVLPSIGGHLGLLLLRGTPGVIMWLYRS